MKGNQVLAKYSDVPNLARAYLSAQEMIGKKGIVKPGANATPEEWRAFHESLGVPAQDKYELGKFEGVEFPKESLDWAKKAGFEHGIAPEVMTKLMLDYGKLEIARNSQSATQAKKLADEKLAALKTEWGDAFQLNTQKSAWAVRQIAEVSGIKQEELLKWLDSGVGNDTTLMKLMSGAAKLFGEDKMREGGLGDGTPTPSELQGQMKEIQGQLLNTKRDDPRRFTLLQKWESLNKQATGGR